MRSILLGLFIFAVGNALAAPGVIDFRGVPMGASEETWTSTQPDIPCSFPPNGRSAAADRVCYVSEDRLKLRGGDRSVLDFGGAKANSIMATFIDDHLYSVKVYLSTADFAMVVDALSVKFGAPTNSSTEEVRTKGGLRATNEIVTWRVGSTSVTASKYGSSLRESVVDYADDQGRRAFNERRAKEAKEGAKSL